MGLAPEAQAENLKAPVAASSSLQAAEAMASFQSRAAAGFAAVGPLASLRRRAATYPDAAAIAGSASRKRMDGGEAELAVASREEVAKHRSGELLSGVG